MLMDAPLEGKTVLQEVTDYLNSLYKAKIRYACDPQCFDEVSALTPHGPVQIVTAF